MAEPAISVREVGPRDGLQREAPIEPRRRLELIESLLGCGLRQLEVAAFVSEKAVPAMAGAAEIVAGLPTGVQATWWALVPNVVGAQRAAASGIDHVTVTVSASEEYSRRNVGMTVEQSTAQALEIAGLLPHVDVVISCCFGSPYEGDIDPDSVAALAARFSDAGASVTLADTTGVATPARLDRLVGLTGNGVGLHLHDTRGTALLNAYRALELGITRFDASVGGLGGSPFADDAGGNLATEELVYLLDDLGRPTGIDLEGLLAIGPTLSEWVGHPLPGRLAQRGAPRRGD